MRRMFQMQGSLFSSSTLRYKSSHRKCYSKSHWNSHWNSHGNRYCFYCHSIFLFRKIVSWNAEQKSCYKSVDVCPTTILDWTPSSNIRRGLRTWQPPVHLMVGSAWWTVWTSLRLWTQLSTTFIQTNHFSILWLEQSDFWYLIFVNVESLISDASVLPAAPTPSTNPVTVWQHFQTKQARSSSKLDKIKIFRYKQYFQNFCSIYNFFL